MTPFTFFITGATGSVGVELLRLLARSPVPHRVHAVIRANDDEHLKVRWRRLVRCFSDDERQPEDLPSWRPVRGDVELPGLGLDPAVREELAGEVTAVIHSAANVGFTDVWENYRRINLEGTRHTLELAESFRRLERFAHISSLYVAGRRSGPVGEDELEHDSGFTIGGYQQSKYEGELLVRSYMSRLPIAVYRLSLLLGREQDGYVHDLGAVHRFLQFMFQGICPVLPANPQCPFDFLPNDYSARQMLDLFLSHFEAGLTYQISAAHRSITARRWMDLTAEVFARHSRQWQRGDFVTPDIVDWEHYRLYVDTVNSIDNASLRKVTRILDSCAEELFYPKVFERARVDRALDVPVPDYEVYYPKLLEYCITTRWGRKPRYERI
jgi:long-chain acyl-CoA synthetase